MVRLSHSYNDREYYQKTFDKLDIGYRVLVTKGIIVDLAMISGLWASGGITAGGKYLLYKVWAK